MSRETYEHQQEDTVFKEANKPIEKATGRPNVIAVGKATYRAIYTW